MLAKLIKHEFKATARIFLPILGTVLVLTGAAAYWCCPAERAGEGRCSASLPGCCACSPLLQ